MGGALEVLSGVMNSVADYAVESKLQSQQYSNEKKLAGLAYQNQRELNYHTALDKARGLRDAGMNPQMMAGDYSVASAPQGHAAAASGHGSHINLMQAELAEQQIEQSKQTVLQSQAETNLFNAQADLVDAQAKKQRIVNNREETADKSYSDYLVRNGQETLQIYKDAGVDTEMIANLEEQIDKLKTNPTNLGEYEGQMKAVEAGSKTVEGFANKIYNLLRMMVDSKQLQDDVTTSSIAEMPKLERQLKLVKMALDSANAFYLTQEGNYSKEKIKLIADQQNKLKAEVQRLVKEGKLTDIQAKHIYENDTYLLISDGEYGKALRNVLGAGLEKGADAASYMIPGKAAAGALKKLSNTPIKAVEQPVEQPVIHAPKPTGSIIIDGQKWF